MEAICEPASLPEDLERVKNRLIDHIESTLRYSSDEELAKAVLYETYFAGTPYSHIVAGKVKALKSITLDDVKAFYCEYYTRDNVVLGLGGGYLAQDLASLAVQLAALPPGNPAVVSAPQPAPLQGIHVTIVEKDAPATAISIGAPLAVLRGQRNWYALAVANSWFGEHRNSASHLYQVIRESRGLNYGDYSYLEHFAHAGMLSFPAPNDARRTQIFEIWLRPVANPAAHFTLRAALRELHKLVDQGMSQEDFDAKRQALACIVPPELCPNDLRPLGLRARRPLLWNRRQSLAALSPADERRDVGRGQCGDQEISAIRQFANCNRHKGCGGAA